MHYRDWLKQLFPRRSTKRARRHSSGGFTRRRALHAAIETLESRMLLAADLYEDNDSKAIVDARAEGLNSPNLGSLVGLKIIDSLNLDDTADWYRFQTLGVSTPAH